MLSRAGSGLIISLLLLCAVQGCTCGNTLEGVVPAPKAPCGGTPCPDQGFQAGAARIDLTPIPGVPIGGYSIEGKVSRGVWTRLHARAIYLEDSQHRPLVLVSCDLMILPSGLADRVAALVHASGLDHVGRDRIILSATETHQGPGNFFTDRMHNAVGGSARPGFDPELFEFLARRITQGIVEASRKKQRAILRVSGTADPLKGFFRNRSLPAFLLNSDASQVMEDSGLERCEAATELFPDPRACQAVDPRVDVVEIVSASGSRADGEQPIAVAVFVASHTAVLSSQTEVFSSDTFGATTNLLERGTARATTCALPAPLPTPGVVALFNGAQGDVTVEPGQRDRYTVLARAETLAGHVCALRRNLTDVDSEGIASRYEIEALGDREFRDAGNPLLGNRICRDGSQDAYCYATAAKPEPGWGQLGGAEDGRSILWYAGFREGIRNFWRTSQGMKRVPPLAGDMLAWVEPPEESVPLGVYRIGDIALVALPGEFTTTVGVRIRARVGAALAASAGPGDAGAPERLLLVGFANGHASYVTTPEEYDLQLYEGASSYFGAGTGPFLESRMVDLAEGLGEELPLLEDHSYSYSVGPEYTFRLREFGESPHFFDDGLEQIAQTLAPDPLDRLPKRNFPTYCWYDGVPSLGKGSPVCNGERVLPRVDVIDALDDQSVTNNERGLDLITLVNRVGRESAEWCAIWLVPDELATTRPEGEFYFEVTRLLDVPVGGVRSGSDQAPPNARSQRFTPRQSLLERPSDNQLPGGPAPGGWRCSPWLSWLGLCSSRPACYAFSQQ